MKAATGSSRAPLPLPQLVAVRRVSCGDTLSHTSGVSWAEYTYERFRGGCELWVWLVGVAGRCSGLVLTRPVLFLLMWPPLSLLSPSLQLELSKSGLGSCPSSEAASLELPHHSKFLLMAAYLASYNPARTDTRFFAKVYSVHENQKGTLILT